MTVPPVTISLSGHPLGFADLARIGAGTAVVTIDPAAMARVRAGRRDLEAALAAGVPVYGTTTGVGAMKDTVFAPADLEAFNAGLVRAHHFGTGEPFDRTVVREAIAIRVNTVLNGRAGCTADLVDAYLRLLAADVVPVVRRTGSIGCADIGLMGQIGAVLTGVGEAVYQGRRLPAEAALAAAGLTPFRLAPKDSLVTISSNAIGYAATSRAIRRAAAAVRVLLAAGLANAAAMGASPDPWESAKVVGTDTQATIGAWLHLSWAGSGVSSASHVHDPLSLRMMAQVFAATFDGLVNAGRTVLAATSRTDDNPVIIEGRVLTSGGSLPLDVTITLQAAGLALAHAARSSFNRCVLIGNGRRRELPVNLVPRGVAATGFGPVMKLAGELFVRVLSLAQPVSAQSLVVADGIEDEAAFLPLVVERFERQIEALRRLAALEGLLAAQALDIMGDRPEGVVAHVYDTVRSQAAFYDRDRPLSADVEAIEDALGSHPAMERLLHLAPLDDTDAFFSLGLAH